MTETVRYDQQQIDPVLQSIEQSHSLDPILGLPLVDFDFFASPNKLRSNSIGSHISHIPIAAHEAVVEKPGRAPYCFQYEDSQRFGFSAAALSEQPGDLVRAEVLDCKQAMLNDQMRPLGIRPIAERALTLFLSPDAGADSGLRAGLMIQEQGSELHATIVSPVAVASFYPDHAPIFGFDFRRVYRREGPSGYVLYVRPARLNQGELAILYEAVLTQIR